MSTLRSNTVGIGELVKRLAQCRYELFNPVECRSGVRNKNWRNVIGMHQVQLSIALQRHGDGCADDGVVEAVLVRQKRGINRSQNYRGHSLATRRDEVNRYRALAQ
ncbi:hypothetical protein D3C78_1326870 [compost metagenome]